MNPGQVTANSSQILESNDANTKKNSLNPCLGEDKKYLFHPFPKHWCTRLCILILCNSKYLADSEKKKNRTGGVGGKGYGTTGKVAQLHKGNPPCVVQINTGNRNPDQVVQPVRVFL